MHSTRSTTSSSPSRTSTTLNKGKKRPRDDQVYSARKRATKAKKKPTSQEEPETYESDGSLPGGGESTLESSPQLDEDPMEEGEDNMQDAEDPIDEVMRMASELAARNHELSEELAAKDREMTEALVAKDKAMTEASAAKEKEMTEALAAKDREFDETHDEVHRNIILLIQAHEQRDKAYQERDEAIEELEVMVETLEKSKKILQERLEQGSG